MRALPVAALLTLFASSALAAAGVSPSDATPLQREQAQTRFSQGRDLFAAKKYDEAAADFDASYAIVASPNALLYLARCDRARGKVVEAYAELGRTLTEARELAASDPRYGKTADAAIAERDALTAELAFVTVSVEHATDATTVTIGGVAVARGAWGQPFPVKPGSADVVVQTPGLPEARTSVTLGAGDKKTFTIDPGTPPASAGAVAAGGASSTAPPTVAAHQEPHGSSGTRTAGWVLGGVGVAGLVTFAVAGLASNSTYSDLQTECHGPCPAGAGHESEISRGKTEQTIANVGLVAGVVGVGLGVTLFVMGAPKSDSVALVTGPTWMGVRGTF